MKPFPCVLSFFCVALTSGALLADPEDSKYAKDLQAEKASLETLLASNPNSDENNFLYAAALYLDLAEATAFKSLLISAGVSNSISNFTLSDDWDDVDEDHEFELNTSSNTSEFFSYLNDTLIPRVTLIDSHLAKVSSSALITLSKEQTGADDEFFIDYADVLVLRAMNKALTAHLQITYAYGPSFDAGEVKDLDDDDLVSTESIRDLNTDLGNVVSTSSLTSAKTNVKDAIAIYQTASPLLRNATRLTQDRLFNLEGRDDLEDEAEFLDELEEILTALDNQHNFDDENDPEETIDLSLFFKGKLDLSTMLPDSVGDKFVDANVSDPTFGGIFPNWTQEIITEDLTDEGDIANDLWSGAASLGDDWWRSHWWGTFYAPSGGSWLYHYPLGWMYQATETPGDVWFWNPELGWLWTTSRTFPFIYEYNSSNWLYYIRSYNVLLEHSGDTWVEK